MKSPVILRVFKNSKLVEVKQFDKDQIIFGHEADVNIDLNDSSVSPIHCLIELRDQGYYVSDLGSSSGTFKNGVQVLDEPLTSGDNIEIGPFRIQFFVGVPKPTKVPQAAIVESSPVISETLQATSKDEVISEAKTEPKIELKPEPKPEPKIELTENTTKESAENKSEPSLIPVITPKNNDKEDPAIVPPKLPETNVVGLKVKDSGYTTEYSKKKKNKKTYAPPSEITDLKRHLKPNKGPVLEVIVSWKERIINTYHFNSEGQFMIGSDERAHIQVPSVFVKGLLPFLELKNGCRIFTNQDMSFEMANTGNQFLNVDELIRLSKCLKTNTGYAIKLDQNEMLCVSLGTSEVMIFVRYVPASLKPVLAGPFDFTAGELTSLITSFIMVAFIAVYLSAVKPTEAEKKKEDEQVRLAQVFFNPPSTTLPSPTPTTLPPQAKTDATPPPPTTTLPLKRIQVTDKPKPEKKKADKASINAVKETAASKAAEVRPNPSNEKKPKVFTSSVEKGGAVKMGDQKGSNAQTKDVTQMGLAAAFGGSGLRKNLDKAYSGSGGILGLSDEATGRSGDNENRAGDDLGSKFKNVGAGGKGIATQGISGIGTKGRSSGMSTYGSGTGLGGKGQVNIEASGDDAAWEGTIDREAVRRVIRSILSQIKSCYERQLRSNSQLEGKVVIQFEIGAQGRVDVAKTRSTTLNDATTESCVAARIKEARFPEPPPGSIAVVDYPFVFGAQK